MTYLTHKATGLPKNRIIGMGGALDSARFKYRLAEALDAPTSDIDGMVIGGHSDTGMFPYMTIISMLRNKTYIGTHTFHDKESGLTFTNENLPLVDKKLFYDVQKRLDKQGMGKNFMKHEYLLRDIISCPCGTPMNCRKEGTDKIKNPSLYRCRNQDRTYKKRPQVCDDCVPMRSIKMEPLDDFIWDTLLHTLMKLKPTSAKGTYMKSIFMSSTMSPSVAIDPKEVAQ